MRDAKGRRVDLVHPDGATAKPRRRARTRWSEPQLAHLRAALAIKPNPTVGERRDLAKQLRTTAARVSKWANLYRRKTEATGVSDGDKGDDGGKEGGDDDDGGNGATRPPPYTNYLWRDEFTLVRPMHGAGSLVSQSTSGNWFLLGPDSFSPGAPRAPDHVSSHPREPWAAQMLTAHNINSFTEIIRNLCD